MSLIGFCAVLGSSGFWNDVREKKCPKTQVDSALFVFVFWKTKQNKNERKCFTHGQKRNQQDQAC